MKLTSLLCFVFISIFCHSQLSLVDSLRLQLQRPDITSDQRAEALNNIAWYCIENGDPTEGIPYTDTLKALGRGLGDLEIEGLGYLRAAGCYHSLSNDSMTLLNYNGALRLFKACNHTSKQLITYQNWSIFYSDKSRYTEAIEMLDKAIAIAEQEGKPELKAGCYNSKGVNQMQLTDYDGATQSFLNAMRAYEELKDSLSLAVSMTNIAIIHNRLGEYQKALEIYRNTEAIYKRLNNRRLLADNYGNMGNTLADLGNKQGAMRCYDLCIQLADSIGYERSAARQRLNKASLLLEESQLVEAYPLILSSLKYFQRVDEKVVLAEAHLTHADFYNALTKQDAVQLHLPLASSNDSIIQHSTYAIDYSEQAGAINLTAEAYEKRSMAFADLGKYENALNDYTHFIAYRDSSINEEKKIAVARNSMKYEFDKKELLLQTQAEKQRVVKNSTIAVASSLFIFLIVGWGFYKRKRDLELKATEKEFQFTVSDTEMKALRSQMNPHFIFNALNSIADFIRKNEASIADDYLAKFARLMRLVLENSEKQEVPLEKDMEALSLYLSLEQLRLKNKFTFNVAISEDIDPENTLIPPLILQPFVENSVWHGISHKIGDGHIQINIHRKDDQIICSVEDDGVGRKNTNEKYNLDTRKSYGMKITQQRLNILNQLKSANAQIQIDDIDPGTSVEINLPLSLNY